MLTFVADRVRRVRRTPSGGGADTGITLTELLVTMSLMSIVGALALSALIGTSNASTRTTEAGLTTAGARTTVSAWTALLQVAVVPDRTTPAARNLAVTPTSISFNAQLENLPGCLDSCTTNSTTAVTLALRTSGGSAQLVQTLQRGTDATTRILVDSGVAQPAGDCLFHPYGYDGTDLGCSTFAADKTAAVGRIDIAFAVSPAAGPTQSFTSSVTLPGAA